MYKIYFTPQAQKDSKKLSGSHLKDKVIDLIEIIRINPYAYPPKYEVLHGKLEGLISRRINDKHRLIYDVNEESKVIKIVKMWTHYE